MPHDPPDRIDTPRLTLRPWRAADAPDLCDVVRDHVTHLRPWMPWATAEAHADVDVVAERLARFGAAFAARLDWSYVMRARDGGRLLGALGLHDRADRAALEIGYWVRADAEGRGFVTEGVTALVAAAFATCDVAWLEIRCDPRNTRSWAVAERAGFRHVETLHDHVPFDGSPPRDTMVWRRDRDA